MNFNSKVKDLYPRRNDLNDTHRQTRSYGPLTAISPNSSVICESKITPELISEGNVKWPEQFCSVQIGLEAHASMGAFHSRKRLSRPVRSRGGIATS